MVPQNELVRFRNLDRLYNPSSIAIVGVSAEGTGFGRCLLLSHIAIGYEGKLYPVNKSGGTIEGLPVHSSVDDIRVTSILPSLPYRHNLSLML